MAAGELSRSFRAMNTDVLIVVVDDGGGDAARALGEVEATFATIEATLSRFRPDSELSRLNRAAGQPFPASDLLFQVVEAAVITAASTNGLFDPTVLGALVAAGYDRSFELVDGLDFVQPGAMPGVASAVCWSDIRLDPATQTIWIPRGAGLDLGGIGKGWTVDRAVDRLRRFCRFAIDAGGDIYLGGVQADGSPWTVGVQDPRAPDRDVLVLELTDRAVATSTVTRRRWERDGRVQHHLIDPRTGEPSQSGVIAATVVADTATRADTLAKVALLLGPEAGLSYLSAQPRVEGLLILADGQQRQTPGLHEARHAA